MTFRAATLFAVAATSLALAGCGVIFAPFKFAEAVSSNANYVFKGTVIDPSGQPLDGVVAVQSSERTLWAPLEGTTSNRKDDYVRVDRDFQFAVRGSSLSVIFSKNGYRDAVFHFAADANKDVSTNVGDWRNTTDFTVLLIPVNAREAYLAHHTASISYEHYPIVDVISLPNLLTAGATGDIVYKDKEATEPTVIPDGTFYALMDSAPPKAINQYGQIDPAELDIPNSLTLHIAGPNTGFIRMTPRPGLHPMLTSILAPESNYAPELTINRERLKEMRKSDRNSIAGAYEYFYFRVDNRFGKGVLYWSNSYGKPQFVFDIYVQSRPATRDLTTFTYSR